MGLDTRHRRGRRLSFVCAAALGLAALLAATVAPAQNTIAVGGASVVPGQVEVIVPISATTGSQLTGLDAAVTFDPALCARLETQSIRKTGRTAIDPQEGVGCPGTGQLSLVLFSLTGDVVLPAGEGPIAEWVFSVRADAAGGTFPLTLVVNQARNGPLRIPLSVGDAGAITIEGATVTPTPIVDTPTATPSVEPTIPAPATATSTATSTAVEPTAAATATATATASASPTNTGPIEPTATPVVTVTPPALCTGDCNHDHVVTINELILGVNIALGNTPLDQCTAFDASGDGMVAINELIAAVNNASNGCPSTIDIGPTH